MAFGARFGEDRNPQDPSTTTAADGTFEFPLPADRAGLLDVPGDELVLADNPPNVFGRKGDQDLAMSSRSPAPASAASSRTNAAHDRRRQGDRELDGLAFGTSSSSTTDADGRFTVGKLRPGKWALRTASGQFLPTIEEFTLAAEERRTDLVLVVKPGQAIVGQVLDDRGLPVAGLRVGSKRKEARGGVDIERFTPDEAATTDRGGYFDAGRLSGETATVRAFGAGHTAAVAHDVPIAPATSCARRSPRGGRRRAARRGRRADRRQPGARRARRRPGRRCREFAIDDVDACRWGMVARWRRRPPMARSASKASDGHGGRARRRQGAPAVRKAA